MNCIFDQTLLDNQYYENLSKFYSLKGSYVVNVVQKHDNRENGPYKKIEIEGCPWCFSRD